MGYAFYGCSSLTAINVAADNTQYSSVGGVLYNKSQTTLLNYPAEKQVSTFTIPGSVTRIENHAFMGCSQLTSVVIPVGITNIGTGAFSGCSGLTSITNLNPEPQSISRDDLDGVALNRDTLYVLASAIDAYRTTDVWNDFRYIRSIGESTGIEWSQHATTPQAYPNPTNGIVYVNNANNTEIKVHNLKGELLQTTRKSRVDLSDEPNGVYLLRIGGQTLKVVKK